MPRQALSSTCLRSGCALSQHYWSGDTIDDKTMGYFSVLFSTDLQKLVQEFRVKVSCVACQELLHGVQHVDRGPFDALRWAGNNLQSCRTRMVLYYMCVTFH